MMGVLVGDAAGAPLEFFRRAIRTEDVKEALTFSGGGVWSVAPGQITDDGELTLCLARGLASGISGQVASEYVQWYRSRPFDIGNTTARAFSVYDGPDLDAAMRKAARGSMPSKANGSLMRCCPIAIYGHRLSEEALVALARDDSGRSHPNPACTDAVAAYTLALRHLMTSPGDAEGAFGVAKAWADKDACEEVRAWMEEAQGGEGPAYAPMIGFVRIAFTHAMRLLKRQAEYEEALFEVLLGGGDTDTNAAIVGGLIGGLRGRESIPAKWRDAVTQCDTRAGQARPQSFHPRQVPSLVERLLERAPAN